VQARPVGVVTRTLRLVRRNRPQAVMILLAFLLVVGGPLVFAWYSHGKRLEIERERDATRTEKSEKEAALAREQEERRKTQQELNRSEAHRLIAQSSAQLAIQTAASIDSFTNAWDVGLAIFGLHLAGLGILLFKFAYAPRLLGVLVSLAGLGYLGDSFGKILVPDYALTISIVTFVGEALLMLWLLWRAFKGFPANSDSTTALDEKAGSLKVEPAPIAVL